jgi:hypothetical protein
MIDYDSVSVHELLGLAFNDEFMWSIESALRKAVIREASAGTIEMDEDPSEIGWSLKDKEGKFALNIPFWHEGIFDLIPHKETP